MRYRVFWKDSNGIPKSKTVEADKPVDAMAAIIEMYPTADIQFTDVKKVGK